MTNHKLDLELSGNIEWGFFQLQNRIEVHYWNLKYSSVNIQKASMTLFICFFLSVFKYFTSVLMLTPIYLRKAIKDTF